MFEIKNNERRNKTMSLRGRAVGSDVVIFHAETEKAQSLLSRCCTSEKQKESSLVQRKSERQAIFKFVLSSASGGAEGGKYNLISAFVSMPVLLIRRSLEKFFKKNFRDDSSFCFGSAKVKTLSFLRLRGASDIVGIRNVITRRTSVRRGYLPEQGTHENKESLFTSVTWLMRLPRRIQRMLLVMTIPALALILTLATTTESLAGDAINCLTGQQSCGINCCWSYDAGTKKLSITGGSDGSVGVMDDYSSTGSGSTYKTTTPWEDYRRQIQSVDIKGVGNVGKYAFRSFLKIKEVNMDENITSIGGDAFWHCNITNLQLPDSIKTIEEGAFSHNENSEMFIPDTLEYMGRQKNKNSTKRYIICKGNEDTCLKIKENLNIVGEYEFSLAKKEQCIGTNYYWSGTNCNNKKNGIMCASAYSFDDENNCIICDKQGYRNVDGYCNRIRWTPAEAAEVLHNDNTNEVTITFKK